MIWILLIAGVIGILYYNSKKKRKDAAPSSSTSSNTHTHESESNKKTDSKQNSISPLPTSQAFQDTNESIYQNSTRNDSSKPNKMTTKLEVFCYDGNALKRTVSYVKASWDNYSVIIKDLFNQTSWQYDEYHDTLSYGKYVLLFVDQEGNTSSTTHVIEINDSSPHTIYVVFSYSKILMLLSVMEKTEKEIDELISEKRLSRPTGYRGY